MSTVLVTGGSGFLGSYVILKLLADGHQVRTTVRNLGREAEVRNMLLNGGVDAGSRLSFYAADLEKDAGWTEAVSGCEYVLHVASPLPTVDPKDENEVIRPAREGTLRVLKAARDAGVKRVVLTSSFAAIGYGHPPQDRPFNESDWTNADAPGLSAYIKSKPLAEKAAWDFIAREGGSLELSVINPVGIFGPVLGADFAGSVEIVKGMLDGKMPAVPKIYFGIVDVRDVADLHVKAMTHPAAKGERFLAAAGNHVSLYEIGRILRRSCGHAARRAPKLELPNALIRLIARFVPQLRGALSELGRVKAFTNEKARRVLDWHPRSNEELVKDTAESLIRRQLVKE